MQHMQFFVCTPFDSGFLRQLVDLLGHLRDLLLEGLSCLLRLSVPHQRVSQRLIRLVRLRFLLRKLLPNTLNLHDMT
jgi:hypothetical protein